MPFFSRNQDLKDQPLEKQLALGAHFGPLHSHSTTAHSAASKYLHTVYKDAQLGRAFLETVPDRNSSITWHSDITNELNPVRVVPLEPLKFAELTCTSMTLQPSTTFLIALEVPPTGGDTLFSSSTEAYKRLSPAFRERLHGLKAVHSSFEQHAESVSRGGPSRRPPTLTEHPIVRRHPVTGEEMLFVNAGFTRKVVGVSAASLFGARHLVGSQGAAALDHVADFESPLTLSFAVQEGGERLPPQLPLSAHRFRTGFPVPMQVGGRHSVGVGQPRRRTLCCLRLRRGSSSSCGQVSSPRSPRLRSAQLLTAPSHAG